MTGKRRLNKSLHTLNYVKQDVIAELPGTLGVQFKGQTLVEVPNRPGYVYVLLRSNTSEVIQAYNAQVSPVYGLPVIVIRDETGNRYKIKERDLGRYDDWGDAAYLPRHAAQHSFPEDNWGGDIVWVYDRQFMPLLVSPPSGTSSPGSVTIYPDVVYKNSNWYYAGAVTSPSLLGYKPISGTSVLVLVYLDVSGTVQYTVGSGFNPIITETQDIIPYIPAIPLGGMMSLAAVKLSSGTYRISWNEIYDLRPIVGGDITVANYTGSVGHTIQDEGTSRTQRTNLNFKGSTVWAIDNPGSDSTDIIISGSAGGGGHTIEDEGTPLTQRTKLDFKGKTVWAIDNAGSDASDVSISGTHVIISATQPSGTSFPGMLWLQIP